MSVRPARFSDVVPNPGWPAPLEGYGMDRWGADVLTRQAWLQVLYNAEWQKRGFKRSP